jgi:hypothetical protein
MDEQPVSRTNATLWLWLIIGGGLLLLLGWIFRFPWG